MTTMTIKQFEQHIHNLRAQHRKDVANKTPVQFTEADLAHVVAVCDALQHPSFGAAGQWLKVHAPDVFLDSCDEENDTINAPGFSIQVVTEYDSLLGSPTATRRTITYHTSVAVTTSGGHLEPDDTDLSEIGDATSLDDALYLVYEYACRELFRGAMQSLDK